MEIQSPNLKYDALAMLSKPMMMGMVINVMIPAALVVFCYWRSTSGVVEVRQPDLIILSVFGFIALAEIGTALFFKQRLLTTPMVSDRASAEAQMANALFKHSLICHALLSAIVMYGVVGFFLWGDFKLVIAAAVISFIAYQFIRFRIPFVEKYIERQDAFVQAGKFASVQGKSL